MCTRHKAADSVLGLKWKTGRVQRREATCVNQNSLERVGGGMGTLGLEMQKKTSLATRKRKTFQGQHKWRHRNSHHYCWGNSMFKAPFLISLGASRSATWATPGNLFEMQSLGSTPDLRKEMLWGQGWGPAICFHKFSRFWWGQMFLFLFWEPQL